ncbi:hypothetical protein [Streptomyces sp. WM6368]|nr:hypothetical protein [Streptomyces sp. WM6368]
MKLTIAMPGRRAALAATATLLALTTGSSYAAAPGRVSAFAGSSSTDPPR